MAEAIGIALAVLPLMISAAEHINTTRRFIFRYRKFSSELRKLLGTLNRQQAIFRIEVKLLMTPAVGRNVAEQMLNNLNHSEWTSDSLDEALKIQLGDALPDILENISLITERLRSLEKTGQKYCGKSSEEQVSQRPRDGFSARSR